jgi:uncharacterized protein YjiS (DUF1127 family)
LFGIEATANRLATAEKEEKMSHSISAHLNDAYGAVRNEFRAVKDFLGHIRQHVRHQRELNQLLAMSDYELRDIGLQRGDILRESLKPIWRL